MSTAEEEYSRIEVRPAQEGIPGMHFPRCCDSPAPAFHTQVYCGNMSYTDIYCQCCDTTLGRMIWDLRYDPEAHYETAPREPTVSVYYSWTAQQVAVPLAELGDRLNHWRHFYYMVMVGEHLDSVTQIRTLADYEAAGSPPKIMVMQPACMIPGVFR